MEEFAHAHISPGVTHKMFDVEHPGHPGQTCEEYDSKGTALNLDAIVKQWCRQCGPCDFGLVEFGCTCPTGDYRIIILELVREIERLRERKELSSIRDPDPIDRARWMQGGLASNGYLRDGSRIQEALDTP